MTPYIIEFRFQGRVKSYLKSLIYDVSRKFHVSGVTKNRAVPHICIIGPFSIKGHMWPISMFKPVNERLVVKVFNDTCSKYKLVPFYLKEFGKFDDTKVVYVKIIPSQELLQLHNELVEQLKPFCGLQSYDLHEDYKPHATIAFKDINRKFGAIWNYVNRLQKPDMRQYLLRVTLIKNSKILYEYDLMQRRLLNRQQAKNKELFRKTIDLLKQQSL